LAWCRWRVATWVWHYYSVPPATDNHIYAIRDVDVYALVSISFGLLAWVVFWRWSLLCLGAAFGGRVPAPGNGHCARPVETDYHFESICGSRTFFVTTNAFRPTLQARRDDAQNK